MPQPAQLEAAPRCMGHKTNGDPCPNPRKHGYNVCTTHGARTPRGLASPNYKHGKYSQHLPEQMQAKYDAHRADLDYLNRIDEVALITARIATTLEIANTLTRDEWAEVRTDMAELRKLGDSERARLVQMQVLASADQLAMIFGEVSALILANVTERPILQALSNGLHDIAKRHLNLDK